MKPESPEVLLKFNEKRKAARQAHGVETGHDSWQGKCPRCGWTGLAGRLGSVLSDCVHHDSYNH